MLKRPASKGLLVTVDKKRIAYEHYRHGHKAVVIIAHGFYNSKDAVILKRLAGRLYDEYDVFMFDFRGHGTSSGLFTWTSQEGKDLDTVLDHLNGHYEYIGILAFSMGASVAINTASCDKRIDSLVCVSTPSDCEKIDYQFWKLDRKGDLAYTLFTKEGRIGRGFRPGPFWYRKKKPIDTIAAVTAPVLYIHGDKDWVVKPWHSKALYDKTRSRKKHIIIKNGPHAEYIARDYFDRFIKDTKQWFKDTLTQEA